LILGSSRQFNDTESVEQSRRTADRGWLRPDDSIGMQGKISREPQHECEKWSQCYMAVAVRSPEFGLHATVLETASQMQVEKFSATRQEVAHRKSIEKMWQKPP